MAQANSTKKIFDGRYEILSIVGRGSASVVYHARHVTAPPTEVALKVLINKKDGESNSDRLRREALAMVSSRHKHVIRLDDFHSVDRVCYLAMEYAPESDLRVFSKKKGGKLNSAQAERFMSQIAEALAFIHQAGMLHRDIKPDNILVMNERLVKLGDFGVALLPGEETTLEELKKGIGTLDYMAPEIFKGDPYGKHSDIYLMGVTFYELLSGVQPFVNIPIAKVLDARKEQNIPHLLDKAPATSPQLAEIIMRCLAFDIKDRFANGRELLNALKEIEGLDQAPVNQPDISLDNTKIAVERPEVEKAKTTAKPVAKQESSSEAIDAAAGHKLSETKTAKPSGTPAASNQTKKVQPTTAKETKPGKAVPSIAEKNKTENNNTAKNNTGKIVEHPTLTTKETKNSAQVQAPASTVAPATAAQDPAKKKRRRRKKKTSSQATPQTTLQNPSQSGATQRTAAQPHNIPPQFIKTEAPTALNQTSTVLEKEAKSEIFDDEPTKVEQPVVTPVIKPTEIEKPSAKIEKVASLSGNALTGSIDLEQSDDPDYSDPVSIKATTHSPEQSLPKPATFKKAAFIQNDSRLRNLSRKSVFLIIAGTLALGFAIFALNVSSNYQSQVETDEEQVVEHNEINRPEVFDDSTESEQNVGREFPHLSTGLYTGQLVGFIRDIETPFNLLIDSKAQTATIILGIGGWEPISIKTNEIDNNTIRVQSQGYMFTLHGQVDGDVIVGTYKNLTDEQTGTWHLNAN